MVVLLNDHINENYVFVDYCEAVSHYEQVAERIANNRFSVSTPVSDHVGNMAHFGNFGGTVDIEPFGQLGTQEYRHDHIIYAVEALECLTGFIQIRIGMQEFCNPFFDNRSFQIIFGVDSGLLGNKHAHGTLQQPVVGIRWFQIMLELTTDPADTVIQMFDDMEHIDADDSLGKDLPCHRDEAVVHVTAVKADLYRMITKAVMWRDYVKNFEEILIGQNAGFALGCVRIWETDGSIF